MTIPSGKSNSNLREVITDYLGRHLSVNTSSQTSTPSGQSNTHRSELGLKLIRIIPWFLFALFILSFIWDFDQLSLRIDQSGIFIYSQDLMSFTISNYTGLRLPPFDRLLPLEGLIVTVSAAGLIGFFTNWLAITMLFHPRKRRPILGQGIIPASRDRVADLIALAISRDLINEEVILERIHISGVVPKYREIAMNITEGLLLDQNFQREIKSSIQQFITEKLESPELKEKIVTAVMSMIDSAANKGFAGVAVKVYRVLNRDGLRRQIEEAIEELPQNLDLIADEVTPVLQTLPQKIAQRSDEIEVWLSKAIMSFVSTLNFFEMVSRNLRDYDDRRFEDLIKRTSSQQLIYIKYLGGALGAIGGLVIFDQWLALPFLALVLGAVVALDYFVIWIMKRRGVT